MTCKNCGEEKNVLLRGDEEEAIDEWYSFCSKCRDLISEMDWKELRIRRELRIRSFLK